MSKQQEHPYKVRIPLSLWEDLEQLAQDEERSINWEIVQAIRERIAQKGKMQHEELQVSPVSDQKAD